MLTQLPVLLVGHCCHDTLYLANGNRSEALGGAVSYVSNLFDALQVPYQVVSKVGADFAYTSRFKEPPRMLRQQVTTHFIADFTRGDRESRVASLCEPIYPEDIPEEGYFPIGLAIGIIGEVLPATLCKVIERSEHVLCDAQGLLRKIDEEGKVSLNRLEDTPFRDLLGKLSFLKASRQEAAYIDIAEARKQTCVIMTEGEAGCTVFEAHREYRIPAFQAEELDSTGAGDCFLAGLTTGLLQGFSVEKAARLGNYLGALAVGQVGVPEIRQTPIEIFKSVEASPAEVLSWATGS